MSNVLKEVIDWLSEPTSKNEGTIPTTEWDTIVIAAKCGYFSHAGFGLPEAGNFGADLTAAMIGLEVQKSIETTPTTSITNTSFLFYHKCYK